MYMSQNLEHETRQCHKCERVMPLDMFYVNIEQRRMAREGRKGWRMHCRLCQRDFMAARLSERRSYVDAIKLAAGCADCGIFDHVRGEKVAPVHFGRSRA